MSVPLIYLHKWAELGSRSRTHWVMRSLRFSSLPVVGCFFLFFFWQVFYVICLKRLIKEVIWKKVCTYKSVRKFWQVLCSPSSMIVCSSCMTDNMSINFVILLPFILLFRGKRWKQIMQLNMRAGMCLHCIQIVWEDLSQTRPLL